LIMYCGMIGEIILYSALEFQSVNFSEFGSNVSFFSCLILNVMTVGIVLKMVHVNMNIHKSKKNTSTEEQKGIEKRWANFRAVFETYKNTFLGQQIFLIIFLGRVIGFNLIVGYGYKYPLIQALAVNVVNLVMALYLIIMRPMKTKINLAQQISLELFLLLFNMCVLILAILDAVENEALELRRVLGEIIIVINIVVPFVSSGLVLAKITLMGIEVYRNYKKPSAPSVKRNSGIPEIKIIKPPREVHIQKDQVKNSLQESNSSVLDVTSFEKSEINSSVISRDNNDLDTSISPFRNTNIRSSPLQYYSYRSSISQTSSLHDAKFDIHGAQDPLRRKISVYSKEAKMMRRPQYKNQIPEIKILEIND